MHHENGFTLVARSTACCMHRHSCYARLHPALAPTVYSPHTCPYTPPLVCLHLPLQDVELYLTKESRETGFTLVARSGRMLQELLVDTSLSKDAMKKALTRVLSRVR